MSGQPNAVISHPEDAAPLPRSRAFVLRLSSDTDVQQARLTGRIEHVLSGQTIRFTSLPELLSFLAQVLDQETDQPP